MTVTRLISVLLLVTVSAVLFQPAPAEAVDATLVLALVGVGVAVVIIVAVIIIANVREGQRGTAAEPPLRLYAEVQGD